MGLPKHALTTDELSSTRQRPELLCDIHAIFSPLRCMAAWLGTLENLSRKDSSIRSRGRIRPSCLD